MAASAVQIREVGLVLQEGIATLKTNVDAVNTALAAMNFKGADNALPTDVTLKAQLTAYNALTVPGINISDALSAVRSATE